MHPELIDRFPRLGLLYKESRISSPDNYFSIYDKPDLLPSTEKQFIVWENLLCALDDVSFGVFRRKSAGRVAARTSPDRGWSQLVESMNEVRGYQFAQSLGYSNCRLLDEQGHPFPDIEGVSSDSKGLIEVKTIQESDEEIAMRGQPQMGQQGLPKRLQNCLRRKYSDATRQIAGHPWSGEARKICYMVINLDLPIVLVDQNKRLLERFLTELQRDVEIQYVSQFWPPEPEEQILAIQCYD
jgi:hypothetical protein